MTTPRQQLVEEILDGHGFLMDPNPEYPLDAATVMAIELGMIRRLMMIHLQVFPPAEEEEA